MIRFLPILIFSASAFGQLGWTDLGPNTVLKGSAFKAGLYGVLVDCPHAGAPYCGAPAGTFAFAGLEQYVFAAQSDCGIDIIRNHMYCTGGGHGDYYGNQIYDFDINAQKVTRLTDPSQIPVIVAQYNLDGTGVTSHTGQSLVYLPNEDCMLNLGIGVGPSPTSKKFGWWVCNLRTSPTWIPKAAYAPVAAPWLVGSGGTGCTPNSLQTGSFTNGGGTGGTFSVWINGSGVPTGYATLIDTGSGYTASPTTGTVATCSGTTNFSGGLVAAGGVYDGPGDQGSNIVLDTTSGTESVLIVQLTDYTLWRYTPSLDTGAGSSPFSQLSGIDDTEIPIGATCRVDPGNVVMICAGASFGGGGFPSGIYSIDLSGGSSYVATNITTMTTGCSALYAVTNPGLEYDSATGMLVGYLGTGNAVTIFNVATKTCTSQTFSGGPTAPAYPSPSGTYDRFAYFPAIKKFVVANNATADMFALDLGSAPTITSSPTLTTGTQNSPYSFALTATGTIPITWALTSGTLPTGVSLNTSTGAITGTPTVFGTFTFHLTATNGYGSPAAQDASLIINPVCLITSSSMAAGKFGIPYSQAVSTAGCASPTFSKTAGTLPTNLNLNTSTGVISGTPTAPGLFSFTIGVTDANGNPTQPTSITIVPGPGIFSVTTGPGLVIR